MARKRLFADSKPQVSREEPLIKVAKPTKHPKLTVVDKKVEQPLIRVSKAQPQKELRVEDTVPFSGIIEPGDGRKRLFAQENEKGEKVGEFRLGEFEKPYKLSNDELLSLGLGPINFEGLNENGKKQINRILAKKKFDELVETDPTKLATIGRSLVACALEVPKFIVTSLRILAEQEVSPVFALSGLKKEDLSPELQKIFFQESGDSPAKEKFLEATKQIISGLTTDQARILAPIFDDDPNVSSINEALSLGIQGGASLALMVGAYLLTKNPNVTIGFLSMMDSSSVYNDARDAGKSPEESLQLFAQSSSAVFALEKLGLDFVAGKMINKIGIQNLYSRVALSTLGETGTEVLQTFSQNAIRKNGFDEAQQISEGLMETIIATLPSAGLASAVITPKHLEVIDTIQSTADLNREAASEVFRNMQKLGEKVKAEASDLATLALGEELGGKLGEQAGFAKIPGVKEGESKMTTEEGRRIEEEIDSEPDIEELAREGSFEGEDFIIGEKNQILVSAYNTLEKHSRKPDGERYIEAFLADDDGFVTYFKGVGQAFKLNKTGLENFSLREETAKSFAGKNGKVIEVKVPKDKAIIPANILGEAKSVLKLEDVNVIGETLAQKTLTDITKDIEAKIKKKVPVIKERIKGKEKLQTTLARKGQEAEIKKEEAVRKAELKGGRQAIIKGFKKFDKGIREGTIKTKKQIKGVQDEIIQLLKETNLDASDRAKFIAFIKNTQTPEQLLNKLPELETRIKTLEEKAEIRKVKAQINKELKTAKIKRVNGKPVGKFTPEVQRALDLITKALKLTRIEAEEQIDTNIQNFPDIPPPEIAEENFILDFVDSDKSVPELQSLLEDIQTMKESGEVINALKKFNVQSEIQLEQEFLIEKVTGKKGIEEGKETFGRKPTNKEKLKQTLKGLGKRWVLDWQGQMKVLDFNNSVDDQTLTTQFSTIEQDNQYKELELEFVEDFNNAVNTAYGLDPKKPVQIHKQLIELGEPINLGTFKNTDGVSKELIMTKDEIIERWMKFQDLTLSESFVIGNKFTPEIIDAIENAMTIQDKKFARGQFAMYEKQRSKVNPIYGSIYGVDLPSKENYSPVRREGFNVDATKGVGEFLVEAVDRRALTSSSFITRTKNTLPIASQGSINVLKRHITETNYFVAWVEQIRRFRSDFSDPTVREAIRQEFGGNMLVALDNTIKDLTTNGNKDARRYKVIDFFRTKFTVGALAIKPTIGIKQQISMLAYLEKLNPVDFTLGYIDFWKNPVKNWKIMENESIFLKTRGSNMERDIKAAQESDIFKKYNRTKSFMDMWMLNVKFGDKAAIVQGSWALRKKRLKQGKALSDIIKEYEEFSSSTQQSSDLSRLSEVQRGGSLEKLFTMFKSSPRQYLQKEIIAVKSLFQKDGLTPKNIGRVARIIAIYHVLIPVTFQYIANLGGWDEDDRKEYLRAGIIGSLNGLFIFGDIADSVVRGALGLRVWDNEIPIVTIVDTLNQALRKVDFDDITAEDVGSALFELIDAGNAFGLPAEQAKNMVAGMGDIIDGSVQEGLAQIMGWSPSRSEKRFGSPSFKGLPKLPSLPKLPDLPKLP